MTVQGYHTRELVAHDHRCCGRRVQSAKCRLEWRPLERAAPRGDDPLPSYVALLRGINVNGQRMIPMANLREMAAALGYDRVETYIQTGNLLFESPMGPDEVRHQLEHAIMATFGFEVAVAVRSPEDIARAHADCPYQPGEGEVVYVAFSVTPPETARLAAAAGGPDCGDLFTVTPTEVYILYRHGVHASALSNAYFERVLGVPMTSRNLRTLAKLADLAPRRALSG